MTTKTAARDEFPVDGFREAAPHLRRPFTAAAVKFKVQATWPKGDPHSGLVVCYIDARLAVERLNLIVPHLWQDEYQRADSNLLCRLTVDGITRQDVGDGQGKAGFSDALKRAAVKFGIGVSLYATPKMIVAVQDGRAKQVTTNQGKSLALTPIGEGHVRDIYGAWLQRDGIQAFGEPLDHGDVMDAQGDADLGERPAEATDTDEPTASLDERSTEQVLEAIKRAGMPHDWVRTQLVAAGANRVPEGKITLGTIRSLTPERALAVIAVCEEPA